MPDPVPFKTLARGVQSDVEPCPTVDLARSTGSSSTIASASRLKMVAQMITMPFLIVTIDRVVGPIRFVHQR